VRYSKAEISPILRDYLETVPDKNAQKSINQSIYLANCAK